MPMYFLHCAPSSRIHLHLLKVTSHTHKYSQTLTHIHDQTRTPTHTHSCNWAGPLELQFIHGAQFLTLIRPVGVHWARAAREIETLCNAQRTQRRHPPPAPLPPFTPQFSAVFCHISHVSVSVLVVAAAVCYWHCCCCCYCCCLLRFIKASTLFGHSCWLRCQSTAHTHGPQYCHAPSPPAHVRHSF